MLTKESLRIWRLPAAIAVAWLCVLGGCSTERPVKQPLYDCRAVDLPPPCDNAHMIFPERLDVGYTIVLPGVWGDQPLDYGIVMGLKDADVQSAVELYDWTAAGGQLISNLRDLDHNRNEAKKIAAKIVRYQRQYPNRPVHLVGYSGGGGVAVLALEALPPDHRVTGAILLAPTLAPDYDLRVALSRTEHGIHNFYSPLDAPVLMLLSTALGTTEGRHTLAAGAVGFEVPESCNAAQRQAYRARLPQESYRLDMLLDGHPGGHLGWTNRTFVARHVAPLLDTGRKREAGLLTVRKSISQ